MAAKRPKKIRDTWNLRISKVKKTGDTLISKSQKVTDNYQSIWAPLKGGAVIYNSLVLSRYLAPQIGGGRSPGDFVQNPARDILRPFFGTPITSR